MVIILNSRTPPHVRISLRSVKGAGLRQHGICPLGNLPFPKPLGTLQAKEYAAQIHRTYQSPFHHQKADL